jgi:hypothetical protein
MAQGGQPVRSTIFTFAIMVVLAARSAPAQDQAIDTVVRFDSSAPQGAAPRTSSGKPDLSGVWSPDRTFIYNIESALKKGETLPLQPWAEKLAAQRVSKDDPEANCLPTGVPRMAPYPWRIVQTPTHIFFLFEGNIHSFRQIFTDGRKHPADLNPTWYGDSIGSWDGDTMVVDSIGFNDKFWFDFAGHPHTEQLHTMERYTRPDLGTIQEEATIDDPGAYTKPFTIHAAHRLLPGDELMEYICQENQRDTFHLVGPAGRP